MANHEAFPDMPPPPVMALFERVGAAGADKIRDSLAAILGQRFGSGAIRLRNVAMVGVGVKSA